MHIEHQSEEIWTLSISSMLARRTVDSDTTLFGRNNVNRDAHRASFTGDWEIVHEFYTSQQSSAVNASGDTILHLLILNGHTGIVLRLLRSFSLIENHHLLAQNHNGNTALHEAVRIGSMEIIASLVEKEESLVSIHNSLGETPLFWAATYGKMEILCFLLEKNSDENVLIRTSDFSTILHAAVAAKFYGLAIKINELCPSLSWARDQRGITALHLIAQSPASFRSGTVYAYQNIGTSPFIPLDTLAVIIYMCLPSYNTYLTRNTVIRTGISVFPCTRTADIAKRKHACALELAKQLITINNSSNVLEETDIKESLLLASKHGIIEVVEKIIKESPEKMESVDENDKNIMHLAVEHRRERVFRFLKSKNFPIAKMVTMVDKDGNTPLHLAAKLGKQPLYIHGVFQQMSWEVLWFKEVEQLFPPHLLHLRNFSGHTAEELFRVTHQSLQKSAEEWVKDMSNASAVICTLIAAINFQAAFTVPGGLDQNTGYPIFLHRKYFIPYLFFLSVALLMSLISIGSELAAHLSGFDLEDFFVSLPLKIVIGGITFLISVISTIWAYALGIYLESSPRTDVFQMVLGHAGVWGASIFSILLFISVAYARIRIVLYAFIHLTCHGQGLQEELAS